MDGPGLAVEHLRLEAAPPSRQKFPPARDEARPRPAGRGATLRSSSRRRTDRRRLTKIASAKLRQVEFTPRVVLRSFHRIDSWRAGSIFAVRNLNAGILPNGSRACGGWRPAFLDSRAHRLPDREFPSCTAVPRRLGSDRRPTVTHRSELTNTR
jgi:hypothetical protein